jgi:hypothetical protein
VAAVRARAATMPAVAARASALPTARTVPRQVEPNHPDDLGL